MPERESEEESDVTGTRLSSNSRVGLTVSKVRNFAFEVKSSLFSCQHERQLEGRRQREGS